MNNAPDGWDAYDFSEQVVFDLETGEFTPKAVTYMLFRLGVFEGMLTPEERQSQVTEYVEQHLSEAEKEAARKEEEEAKRREAERLAAEEAARVAEEARLAEEAERAAEREAYNQRQEELKEFLADEDVAVVVRLQEFGFPEDACVQAYLACERDEQLALNFLFDFGAN